MSEDQEQTVEGESADFRRGFAAGLNSAAATTNPEAGNQLGQELSLDKELVLQTESSADSAPPLFMRDSSEGDKGNAQDEKDGTAE